MVSRVDQKTSVDINPVEMGVRKTRKHFIRVAPVALQRDHRSQARRSFPRSQAERLDCSTVTHLFFHAPRARFGARMSRERPVTLVADKQKEPASALRDPVQQMQRRAAEAVRFGHWSPSDASYVRLPDLCI